MVIQGPNGCGKSTLIKLLNGIIFPSEGHYFYKGHEITEKTLKDRQFAKWFHQQMGYVFQNADTQLFCGSVEEEIAFWTCPDGIVGSRSSRENRRLSEIVWNRETQRKTSISSERRGETKSISCLHPFSESGSTNPG